LANNIKDDIKIEADNQAALRKNDHIDLAFRSSIPASKADSRFYYEPLLSAHLSDADLSSTTIAGRTMSVPIWVSSMTGGTEKASAINHNLAKVCGEFGLGMGLGSCRQLLYEDKRLSEFDLREYMPDQPLFINLGVAQIEELQNQGEELRITKLIDKLNADGLIVHVNPMQEWLQPEGDRYQRSALDTIIRLLESVSYPIIVKEVGQGFGIKSLKALLELPIEALDLAGFGGTNFSMLELLRSDEVMHQSFKNICNIGHTCAEMIDIINAIKAEGSIDIKAKKIIISGGIKDFLDGYYLMEKCQMNSVYAQASSFLKYALDIDALRQYVANQIEGLKMSKAFLQIKS
jgi:isopentenyl-diphosphate delta-isomerase